MFSHAEWKENGQVVICIDGPKYVWQVRGYIYFRLKELIFGSSGLGQVGLLRHNLTPAKENHPTFTHICVHCTPFLLDYFQIFFFSFVTKSSWQHSMTEGGVNTH